jgi:hypothetical protein
MFNNALHVLKQNIEFYSMDIEIADNFTEFMKHINHNKHYVLTNFENRTFYKASDFENMHVFSNEITLCDASLLFFIEENDSLLQKHNKLLLNMASNHYKNPQYNIGTIGVCFDENAINILIKMINSNPRIINKLYINTPILNCLNAHFC